MGEINHESPGTYSINSQIKLKTSMIRSSSCDYSNVYIHFKGNITILTGITEAKKVIFKHCVPFTNCISKINNTQVDDAHDIDVVMPMYNLIEYSDIYSKTPGSLWQYYRD